MIRKNALASYLLPHFSTLKPKGEFDILDIFLASASAVLLITQLQSISYIPDYIKQPLYLTLDHEILFQGQLSCQNIYIRADHISNIQPTAILYYMNCSLGLIISGWVYS